MDALLLEPCQVQESLNAARTVLIISVALMVFLMFFVLDATQLCRRFVRLLADSASTWPSQGIKAFGADRDTLVPDSLRELILIRVIAYRTHHVGKLIKYPFIVILILIVSRHTAFDHWSWSWPLITVLALNLGGLVLCGCVLRRECSKARDTVLRRLSDQLARVTASDDSRKTAQVEQIIQEVKGHRGGAFRPLAEDPVMQAIAIPFGGIGGLVLLEQLLTNL